MSAKEPVMKDETVCMILRESAAAAAEYLEMRGFDSSSFVMISKEYAVVLAHVLRGAYAD